MEPYAKYPHKVPGPTQTSLIGQVSEESVAFHNIVLHIFKRT